MLGRLFGALLGLIGLLALVVTGGYFALKRADIPYETLAATYESSASRYEDLPGGVRMHYRDEGLQTPDAPTLLLVHGFAASLQTWEPWVAQLGGEYRIVSIDLPGHGLTVAPAGYSPSMRAFRDSVTAFAEARALSHFTIIGNSMGGNVAWEYAVAHPEQIDALVLVDSSGWPASDAGAGNEPLVFKLLGNPVTANLLRDIDATQLTRRGLIDAFPQHPELVTDAMVRRYTELARGPGHRAMLVELSLDRDGRDPATAERLAPLAAPTLILQGALDVLVPAAHARQFDDAIPNSDLVIFEDVGHVPQEEIPEQSAAAVRDFLTRAHAGPGPVRVH